MAGQFRKLHQPGDPFVLANAWDRGSTRMLANLGAKAIATSSAAHAFTLGLPDGGHVSRDEAIVHAADLAAATTLPLSADLENGYGHDAGDVAITVRRAAAASLAGCCIEDTMLPASRPYDRTQAVSRIEAAATAARAADEDFFLVARADGLMLGSYDLDEAIQRVQAFEAAGADGVFIPALGTLGDVKRVCESVSVPVNVLAVGALNQCSLGDFADAGAARISLGSALARVTHQAIIDAANPIFGEGSFAALARGAAGDTIDKMID